MNRSFTRTIDFKLIQLEIPLCSQLDWGTLFCATFSATRAHDIGDVEWGVAVLDAFFRVDLGDLRKGARKADYAVPSSFWPQISDDPAVRREILQVTHTGSGDGLIEVQDEFCGIEHYVPDTPIEGIKEIVNSLQKGVDVILMNVSKGISGFVPAAITRLQEKECNIVKLWYPILKQYGYELTPFQLGYLYGLTDAGHPDGNIM